MKANDISGLLEVISQMKDRIEALEAASIESLNLRKKSRKKLLIASIGIGMLFTGSAIAVTASGLNLLQFMHFSSSSVSIPPLDTSVRWSRSDPAGVGAGYTNEVLSIVAEATQTNSYTWPLYVQLNATNSSSATQNSSQSAAISARTFQRSTGSPWVVGYHSELFHGKDGANGNTLQTNGTSILYNGELISTSTTGSSIGLNINNTIKSTVIGGSAIQIQPGTMGWRNGIHFDSGGRGNIGINFDASVYNMGIDLANNSLRLNANQKIYLEKFGSVYIQFNSSTNRVEVIRGGKVVASM